MLTVISGIAPDLANSFKKILVEARYLFLVEIDMSDFSANNRLNFKKLLWSNT